MILNISKIEIDLFDVHLFQRYIYNYKRETIFGVQFLNSFSIQT
jgi:hypothetical protein